MDRRDADALNEENHLWLQEVKRSTRDYDAATLEGRVEAIPGSRRLRQAELQAHCRALIVASRSICRESRALRDASRALREG